MGTLFLVATPIGNLEDISARALKTLRQAGMIAAEDTRVTRALLTRYDIHTPITSYFEQNKLTKLDVILKALSVGDVALVSDAGTPAVNDPGYELVRAALSAGHQVSPIPGPSAPLAALAASGLPTDAFLYLGYLPRKSTGRCALLEEVHSLPYTLLFLETPHRLLVALEDLELIMGDRQMAVARELTKLHEEIWRGSISAARAHFTQTGPRGEFTLVVAGMPKSEKHAWLEERVIIAIKFGLKLGENPAELARRVASESLWDRREVYRMIINLQKSKP